MYKLVDRRWDALFGTFCASIVLAGFGVNLCFIARPANDVGAVILFVFAALIFTLHKWSLRMLRNQGHTRDWLKPLDQLIVVAMIGLAIALSGFNSGLSLAGIIVAGVFGTWRAWKYARPYWRSHYFRAGREYFREIKSYRPNNAVKQEALETVRPSP
ncbi:hypothetical protein [Vogesella indigofera]|uniref:hypothetical protein n=1 Tax=Vogesella indigofera TaxID=45465 RepID=UPI0014742A6A|nr:hypothetical protein [Vogesella indigofera]